MKLCWYIKAEADLRRAEDYIALDDPVAATIVSRTIRDAVSHLRLFPDAGRPGSVPGTREVVIGIYPYLVRYRVRDDVVQILRVFHTSRQMET